jgi:DNA-binding LytR/AlgR family response regulator
MSLLSEIYKKPSIAIPSEHLSYITGDGPYSLLHFIDGSRIMFGMTMKRFQEKYPHLIRINKHVLANHPSITDWERIDKKTMRVVVNGIRYWVSRRRIDEVMEQLSEAITNS